MATAVSCPECNSARPDETSVCPQCGAPPHEPGDKRAHGEEEIRTADLEPYITLRYIARLFKVLAVLMVILLIGEIIARITSGEAALAELIGETTRMLVLAGLMWGGGDITLLLIDAGHDVRVVRILLGRINAELHRRRGDKPVGVLGVEQRREPR